MNDPFRLRLMVALCDCLKKITPESGHPFDLSDYMDEDGRTRERVFRGRDIFGVSDPVPLLAVLEDPRAEPSDNGSDGRAAAGKFKVLIQGFVNHDDMHPLDAAYRMSAAIATVLTAAKRPSQDGLLGLGRRANCITAITIGQPVHRPGRDEVSENAYMLVGVTFTLIENLERPFD